MTCKIEQIFVMSKLILLNSRLQEIRFLKKRTLMELVVKMHFHQNYFVIGERIAGYPVSGDTGYRYPVFRLAG